MELNIEISPWKRESEQKKILKSSNTVELCLKSEAHKIKVAIKLFLCSWSYVSRALLAVWKYIPVQKYSFQFLISTVFTKTLRSGYICYLLFSSWVLVSTGDFINLRWSVILTLSGSCSGNLFKFYSSQRHNAQNASTEKERFLSLPKSSRRKGFISTTTMCLFCDLHPTRFGWREDETARRLRGKPGWTPAPWLSRPHPWGETTFKNMDQYEEPPLVHHVEHVLSFAIGVLPKHLLAFPDHPGRSLVWIIEIKWTWMTE